MKNFLSAIALAALLPGSANAATRSFSVTSFDRIRVDGPFRVRLTTAVAPFARATGSAAALDAVAVAVQGRTLIVHPNRSSWGGFAGREAGPVEIAVGTHELAAAWLNGSGALAIDRVKGLSFDLNVQGAGAASIANVAADRISVGIAGAASATLAGRTDSLTAIVRGASSLDSTGLAAKAVKLGAEGPAIVAIFASSTATIQSAGTGTITVAGRPACTVKASGSVTITGCR